jgi:signal recognition particle receptor subunit beta
MHVSTRRLVLEGADGVAFIGDSERDQARANNDFWLSLKENLKLNKIDPDSIPIVIQFNKRDRPNVRSDAEIDEIGRKGKEQIFKAVAINGQGVLETVRGLLEEVWDNIERKHHIEAMLKMSKAEFVAKVFEGASPPREGLVALQQ